MAHKQGKTSSAKRVILKDALKSMRLATRLDMLEPAELLGFAHDLGTYLHWWMGDPTEETLLNLRTSLPLLDELVDFDVVLERLESLDSFKRSSFGVSIGVFFPELTKIHEACISRIHKLPQGVPKAECWLRPIAQHAGADSDVEAAVYLASRGHKANIDIDALRDSWHSAICSDIEHGRPVKKVPETVINRARSRTISLAEAAQVLRFNQSLFRFFTFRDEEEDFIDASMFRTVEWFGIIGFDPWLKSFISDLSLGPQGGIDHGLAGWLLFYWCRSDLALQMAERHGLESWLWALINGQLDRENPWRLFLPERENPRTHDYLPLCGIILFVWHRIKPKAMREDILQRASDLLFQTQMRCGGWPLYTDDSEPCLITTCFALHGLALHKPIGWEQLAARGAEWLERQQDAEGYWYIKGGPTVMLTVLALDALVLARGGREVTFKLDTRAENGLQPPATGERADVEPLYNYDGQEWYEPSIPTTTSVSLVRAKEVAKPRLALIVATETELRQVLRVLKPIPRRQRIWKVTHGYDTYYLGSFGAFQAVVTLSGMGTEGATGATLSVDAVIRDWNPTVVVLVGIVFGVSRKKHKPADVLIAEHLIPYEHQRVGDQPIFRNPIPPSSPILVSRFRHALGWAFYLPDGSKCIKHVGPVLSGNKLIDNREFKDALISQYPSAIGGEMEGTGLWSAAQRARKEWILVKGVCDWADGRKHDSYHAMAAASAVSLCHYVFSDVHALDGV